MSLARPIPLSSLPSSTSARFLTEAPPSPHAEDVEDIFPNSPTFKDPDLAAIHPLWKRNLHAMLEHPTSSTSAFLVHVLITALIIFSAVVTVMETLPAFHYTSGSVWFGIETSLVALFTVEYVARCVAWSFDWREFVRWFASFVGIIDLLAILPYYIEIALQADTTSFFRFSILRTFRLLRVFRPFRYNNTILLTIEVMYLSFQRSQHALLALSFFVVMVLVVFSTLLYFAERGTWDDTLDIFVNADGDPSQFASIPAAAWFVLVTITTVGYGEIVPRSVLGRLITLPLLVFGLLLIALPSFVLGREFSLVWAQMNEGQRLDSNRHPSSPIPTSNGLHSPTRSMNPSPSPDLTNRKLAMNQTELSRQIVQLKATLDTQGEMIGRLLELFERQDQSRIRANAKSMSEES